MYHVNKFCCRNLIIDDKSKEDEEEKTATPEGKIEGATPTGKRKDKNKDKQIEDKKEKRKTSAGKGKAVGRRGSNVATTPPPGGAQTPGSEIDGLRYVDIWMLNSQRLGNTSDKLALIL